VREEKMITHMSQMKDLERELDERVKRIREVQKEKEIIELRSSEELAQVREELDLTKEKVLQLQKNEAIIEVYKKKIDQMAQLQ
jgi:7-keto-8-aminopelargonate synthetase-like enzyme